MSPNISVISIALSEHELLPLIENLNRQTFTDFEFIGEVGGTIPEAWNRAIARAKGEILVFTETDAQPVDSHWLEDLVQNVPDDKTVIKGLEVANTPWNLSNLAGHRKVFENAHFDEQLRWAEDTDFFCQLKKQGKQFRLIDRAPVIHLHGRTSKRMIRRAFRYGMYWARIRSRYAEPVDVAGFSLVMRNLLMYTLQLLGLVAGSLIYWPERLRRKI